MRYRHPDGILVASSTPWWHPSWSFAKDRLQTTSVVPRGGRSQNIACSTTPMDTWPWRGFLAINAITFKPFQTSLKNHPIYHQFPGLSMVLWSSLLSPLLVSSFSIIFLYILYSFWGQESTPYLSPRLQPTMAPCHFSASFSCQGQRLSSAAEWANLSWPTDITVGCPAWLCQQLAIEHGHRNSGLSHW